MSHGMFRNWDHAFPYDDDIADYWAEADGGNYGARKEVKCRHCGSTNVYWSLRDGVYVLYDISSTQHKCEKSEEVIERNVSAFDKLD